MKNHPVNFDNQSASYRIKVGESVKSFREKKGYSQDDLAALMDVNRSTISKLKTENLQSLWIILKDFQRCSTSI
jgi:DNA-binding XRE family transcriptional regulator